MRPSATLAYLAGLTLLVHAGLSLPVAITITIAFSKAWQSALRQYLCFYTSSCVSICTFVLVNLARHDVLWLQVHFQKRPLRRSENTQISGTTKVLQNLKLVVLQYYKT